MLVLLLLLYLSYATLVVVYLYELKIDAVALHLQSAKFCCCRRNSRQNWWRKRWPNKAYTHKHRDTERHTHTHRCMRFMCAVRCSRNNSASLVTSALSAVLRLWVCSFVRVCVCWLAKSGQWTTLNFGAAAATSLWPPGRGSSSSSCCVSCVVVNIVVVVVLLMLQFQIFLAFTL